jgi:hypothetical protein
MRTRSCGWLLSAVLAAASSSAFGGTFDRVDMRTLETPLYTVEGDAFVRHNGDRYTNRPLYNNHISAAVLAGDKPYIIAGSNKTMLGCLMVGFQHGGHAKWLLNASDITAKYRPGRFEWIVKDAAWGDTVIHLEVVPVAEGPGYAAHVHVEGAQAGDQVVWASGGAGPVRENVLQHWDVTIPNGASLLHRGFVPADCEKVSISAAEGGGGGTWSTQAEGEKGSAVAVGHCSAADKIMVGDASAWKDPAALLASSAKGQPIAVSEVPVTGTADIYWSIRTGGDEAALASPAEEFAAGMIRAEAVEHRVVVDTPDPWLNAAVGASGAVTDGVFRNNMYTHAGMRWSVPLIGWRTIFGGTAYGWHDRVKTEAALCIAKQITESDKTEAQADPTKELSSQSMDSRLFGKGRINIYHTYHYDMQSQFFDQIQHAWRWTGDDALQKLLQPSLDLHCEYIKDCFDPDGDGLYESYANTWPTDDQWYNGGGTSEETSYAYRAERTALLLAQRAGDEAGVKLHQANVEHIRKAFQDVLWLPERGHAGAYVEQGGLKRVHESCWLYGIFCPIDAGLVDTEQAAQSLQYTETELERIKMPYGGEQCWPSNWVPSIWSVREMWPGDDYQLALAYFQTGLADGGWSVLRGTFPQQMFFGTVPGDLGHPAGATDFNDCASMFARTVVEGLFGYTPDYPNNLVKIAPEFPSEWDHASIKTPDMSIAYERHGVKTTCHVTLAKACNVELLLPVSATGIDGVTLNGAATKSELVPGFGRSLVKIEIPNASDATVEVSAHDALHTYPAVMLSGNTGEKITLHAADATIVDFHDPQGLLTGGKIENGDVTGTLTANAGDHMLLALAQQGSAQQWRIFKLRITDPTADATLAAKTAPQILAGTQWQPVDMQPVLNGDIRTIYEQKYLSPRPNTVSLRLATDGYATWQMVLEKKKAPAIELDNVPSMMKDSLLQTPTGVPFLWPAGKNNIAFTSRWDNWPKQVEVPVNKTGDAVWFLLCGTTDPMEVRIANAELRMHYADGVEEKLEIVPPMNFWTLCPMGGADYNYERDAYALPAMKPQMVELGRNCRAMVLKWSLRPGVALQRVTLETLSQQVVVGLMGVTVMNPHDAAK